MKIVTIILIILFMALPISAFEVETGYGYFEDSEGHINTLCYFEPGSVHQDAPNYTYKEVATKEKFDKLKVYVPPPTQEQVYREKIAKKMRKLAIKALKDEGELPPDYNEE